MANAKRTLHERFWSKVDVKGPDECWIWTGAISGGTGYGSFVTAGVGSYKGGAHRIAYQLTYGPIPPGLLVCHRCDVRECVNPTHLFLGTGRDNVLDMVSKGRANRAHGERAGSSKLTERQVREIRSASAPHSEIAAQYGISRPLVSRIKRRLKWSYLQ